MRASIKSFHSPDVPALEHYAPEDPACFELLWQLLIGPAGAAGEESFNVVVCTPRALEKRLRGGGPLSGRHHLFVLAYDYARIVSWFEKYVSSCEGDSWTSIAEKLARVGHWEFEDYAEAT